MAVSRLRIRPEGTRCVWLIAALIHHHQRKDAQTLIRCYLRQQRSPLAIRITPKQPRPAITIEGLANEHMKAFL